MKKNTIETMIAYLNGQTVDTAALKNELTAELDKLTAKSRENAAERDAVAPIILDALSNFNVPVTEKELFAAVADKVPEGYTVNKMRWFLLHSDAVEKHDNGKNPNTYTRA